VKKALIFTFLLAILIIGILGVNLVVYNKNVSVISDGTPITDSGLHGPALFIVDIQEGTTGSVSVTRSYMKQSHKLIPLINRLTATADSLQIPVIYIRNEVSNPLINILNNTLAAGSEGTKLDQRLNVATSYDISRKKHDAFSNPELDSLLGELKVDHIYLTGLDLARCIRSTLQGAVNRGYELTILEDAVISEQMEQKEEILNQFREMGVSIINSQDFTFSTVSESE